jgi:Flp pilus assembly protein TadD
MKSILKYLTFLIILLMISFFSGLNAQSNKNDYKGIGFEALDYEKESGFKVNDAAYFLLDSIVRECKSKIKIKTEYSNIEAIEVLNTIGSVIEKFNIVYDTLITYSKALENRKLDCKFFSLTYLTIGENLSLPLYSMNAPEHVFIYWKDKENEICWETTSNSLGSIEDYITFFKIPQKAIVLLAYLNEMNYKQSRNLIYKYCGNAKYDRGNYKEAIIDFNKAIMNNSNYVEVYCTRGLAKSNLKDYNEAIKDYNKAIDINPNYAKVYYNRGIVKDVLEDYTGAIADYSKAIEINPNYANAYNNRGYVKAKDKNYYGAIADYTKALEINPHDAEFYNNRGLSFLKLGDSRSACLDWYKALELGNKEADDYIKKYCK